VWWFIAHKLWRGCIVVNTHSEFSGKSAS
jgi:hypothetical protein